MSQVSKQSGAALCRQVAEDLLARIQRAELRPGERLAPEAQLATQYGVNRLTIRRALEDLTRAGKVRTEHGVGSLVAVPRFVTASTTARRACRSRWPSAD